MSRVGSAQPCRHGSISPNTELSVGWLLSLKVSAVPPLTLQQRYIVLVSWFHLFIYLWVAMCSHNLVETGGQLPKFREVCSPLSPCQS